MYYFNHTHTFQIFDFELKNITSYLHHVIAFLRIAAPYKPIFCIDTFLSPQELNLIKS